MTNHHKNVHLREDEIALNWVGVYHGSKKVEDFLSSFIFLYSIL